ncbi:hypothetical protein [Gelidibacter sp.]|uniref:hypothetical protein n=1 Tax=Gelidibacter sp. TaxID=2018083 RepID=UPI002B8DA9DD|nr:hypothetical protein [Gelidibacter sp.]HUH29188.1 hypothetical protein [Gelidibacter sp.]
MKTNDIFLANAKSKSEILERPRVMGRNLNNALLLTIIMVLGAVGISKAQLAEGTYMLGTDLGSGITSTASNGLFGFNFGLNDGAGFNVGLAPKVGYFVSDNFMLGAVVNLGYTKAAESEGASESTLYGIQALSRYYLAPGEKGVDNLLKNGRFFMEANAGFAGVNVKEGPTTNGFAFGFGPGYSYFLTNNVALETSVKYNGLVGGGNTTYQHSLGLNLGLQIHLPSSDAKRAAQDRQ